MGEREESERQARKRERERERERERTRSPVREKEERQISKDSQTVYVTACYEFAFNRIRHISILSISAVCNPVWWQNDIAFA